MTPTTTTPTAAAAIDYVRAHFSGYDQPELYTVVGTIAPGRDSSGPIDGSRDVLFIIGNDPKPARFTVWHDAACAGRIYGEW